MSNLVDVSDYIVCVYVEYVLGENESISYFSLHQFDAVKTLLYLHIFETQCCVVSGNEIGSV